MNLTPILAFILTTFIPAANAVAKGVLPPSLQHELPPGYEVLANTEVTAGRPSRHFTIVALGKRNEDKLRDKAGDAPDRPLLIFETNTNRLVARNDTVVMRADQGGQCDPFLDGDAAVVVKGSYFTVQNGVACGQHWTDYITFRFDDRVGGFVFDNERNESWSMNANTDPNADALVRDGPQHVRRDRSGHLTIFADWRPLP